VRRGGAPEVDTDVGQQLVHVVHRERNDLRAAAVVGTPGAASMKASRPTACSRIVFGSGRSSCPASIVAVHSAPISALSGLKKE
jgi:hypothetical protein